MADSAVLLHHLDLAFPMGRLRWTRVLEGGYEQMKVAVLCHWFISRAGVATLC